MRMLALGAVAVLLSAVALQATAEARARLFRSSNSSSNVSRSYSQEYQPRSRAGAYAKPSFYQGSHKALGKY